MSVSPIDLLQSCSWYTRPNLLELNLKPAKASGYKEENRKMVRELFSGLGPKWRIPPSLPAVPGRRKKPNSFPAILPYLTSIPPVKVFPGHTIRFCVTDVTHSDLAYEPADDSTTCGSIKVS